MSRFIDSVVTAVALAIIFAIAKLFWDVVVLKQKVEPVVAWYVKTSMDALKIATNPTSERLTELARKYTATVVSGVKMPIEEKQELVDGLRHVLEDKHQLADKRQSASLSLRFIETREKFSLSRRSKQDVNQ